MYANQVDVELGDPIKHIKVRKVWAGGKWETGVYFLEIYPLLQLHKHFVYNIVMLQR